MRTTLQPPGHTALQSLPAPRDALMQADAPLMAYLAQWFACGLPASGTRPSNRDLAGRQAVDGSPPPLSSVGFSLMLLWEAVERHGAGRRPSRDCSATVLGVCTLLVGADQDRAQPG